MLSEHYGHVQNFSSIWKSYTKCQLNRSKYVEKSKENFVFLVF